MMGDAPPPAPAPEPAPAPMPPPAAMPKERPFGVTLLGILYFIEGLYVLVAGLLVQFAFDLMPIDVTGLPMVGDLIDSMKLCIMIVLVVIALFYFLLALGLLKGKSWARTVGIIFAIFGLFAVPVGTIISIIILIYLFKPDVKAYFGK